MNKVGLITCFLDNYGACLQAFALSQTIKQLGFDCEIINYTEPEGYFPNSLSQRIKDSEIYNKCRSLISPKYAVSYKLEKIRRPVFRRFRKNYLPISDTEFKSYRELEDTSLNYNQYVCGSDQIWNPTFYNKCNPAYYLKFVPDNVRKISYAPSIGISDIPEKYQKSFSELVNRFQYISVRETIGVKLVEKYSDSKATLVVDPTLLFTSSVWDKYTTKLNIKKPYIFCYLFGNSHKYQEIIKIMTDQTGLDVVIIPFNEWNLSTSYMQYYTADPFDFISLIKNAEYVFTDSFHASVFSIQFHKNFYTALRHNYRDPVGMNSRIASLLKLCGLENRCLHDENFSTFTISAIDDYTEVDEKINKIRESSLNFLQTALEGK